MLRVVRTPGIAEAIAAVAPDLVVEEVDVAGPPTSVDLRAAGWAEAVVLLAGARARPARSGRRRAARAEAEVVDGDGIHVRVALRRSARRGRAALLLHRRRPHGARLGHAREGLAVDDDGEVHDLTIRSFGIVPRPIDTPPIDVEIEPRRRPAGQRLRRRVRRGGGRRLARPRLPHRLAHPRSAR